MGTRSNESASTMFAVSVATAVACWLILFAVRACSGVSLPRRPFTASDCAKLCAPLAVRAYHPGFMTDDTGRIVRELDTAFEVESCVCWEGEHDVKR